MHQYIYNNDVSFTIQCYCRWNLLTVLNPKISYKIYQCDVLPKILSGIETIPLNKSELNELELFPRKILKSIQYLLPQYSFLSTVVTTRCAPIEAEIHKRQLSLFYSIFQSDNDTVKGILNRQLAVYDDDPESFCGRLSSILQTHNLPPIFTLPVFSATMNIRNILTSIFPWRNIRDVWAGCSGGCSEYRPVVYLKTDISQSKRDSFDKV